MVRRLIFPLAIAVAIALGLWVGALLFLPDALRSPAAGDSPAGAVAGDMLAVPIPGVSRAALTDSWGDPRDNGKRRHHGTDIMAASMTPVLAAAPGTVEKLWTSIAGGTTLYVRSPQRDWTCYYAHLAGYAPGLHEGQAVKAGDLLGYVGDTGDAGPGNYHLHFGLTRTTTDQRWYQGTDVDPFPYLAGKQALR
jgi:murein DD-endopeptidase MepM/ murein hydrolase activator NlpD